VPDLTQYRNIVVGSGVRAGRVYGKARKFLENDFGGKQVAFFISSSMAGTPGSHDNAKIRFVEHTLAKYPKINPVSTEAFGGRIRYFRKTMLDNTDSAKVEAWAEELGQKFTK
jgi:menaquinone-dependent protoporphyrinogen IX oxidase